MPDAQATAFAQKEKSRANNNGSANDDWQKTATCHHCHKKGHIRPNCLKLKEDDSEDKETSSSTKSNKSYSKKKKKKAKITRRSLWPNAMTMMTTPMTKILMSMTFVMSGRLARKS